MSDSASYAEIQSERDQRERGHNQRYADYVSCGGDPSKFEEWDDPRSGAMTMWCNGGFDRISRQYLRSEFQGGLPAWLLRKMMACSVASAVIGAIIGAVTVALLK